MQNMLSRLTAVLAVAMLAVFVRSGPSAYGANGPASPGQPLLTLRAGEHVAVIGNTLADRMQHDG